MRAGVHRVLEERGETLIQQRVAPRCTYSIHIPSVNNVRIENTDESIEEPQLRFFFSLTETYLWLHSWTHKTHHLFSRKKTRYRTQHSQPSASGRGTHQQWCISQGWAACQSRRRHSSRWQSSGWRRWRGSAESETSAPLSAGRKHKPSDWNMKKQNIKIGYVAAIKVQMSPISAMSW